eukprot:10556195-Alexandrium_andersonii.AAC.1
MPPDRDTAQRKKTEFAPKGAAAHEHPHAADGREPKKPAPAKPHPQDEGESHAVPGAGQEVRVLAEHLDL